MNQVSLNPKDILLMICLKAGGFGTMNPAELKEEGSFHKGNRVAWWYQYDPNGNESYNKNFDEIDSSDTGIDSLFNKVEKYPF